jgi:hypothetical protein
MAVTLVTEDQVQDASGNLVDVYVITFTAGPSNTAFTVTVPQAGDAVAAASAAISAKEQEVSGIYGL